MAFVNVTTVSDLKGGDFVRDEEFAYQVGKKLLICNLEAEDDDSRLYAYLYIQVYVPDPIFSYATLLTRPLYTKYEFVLPTLPLPPDLNVTLAFYAPFGNFPTDLEVFLED